MLPIYGDVDKAVEEIRRALARAEDERIDVLCLPECFLTGYFRNPARAARNSIDLDSAHFDAILAELAGFESTLILGLIERTETSLFNSAVIIERGDLVGRYRKQHLVEAAFEPGDGAPIFEKNGIRFGVNICFDANFPEAAKDLVERGAELIFYPLNNSLPRLVARRWRHRHLPNLIDRARDNSTWVVSSDVVERSALRCGYGCTAIVDPAGTVVERSPESEVGWVKSRLTVPASSE
jgi:predicted amidohydrolase